MTTLMIVGAPTQINLSTEGNGVYSLETYSMGTPLRERPSDDSEVGSCIDTITLNVVGKDRAQVTNKVAQLYQSLVEAVNFHHGRRQEPCYLKCLVTNQDSPVSATISDFEFHELNDPFDIVNGRIIRSATLAITRTTWSELPPQTSPFEILGFKGEDASNKSRPDVTMYRAFLYGGSDTGTQFSQESRASILSNSIRALNINAIAQASFGGFDVPDNVNLQPTQFPNPGDSYVVATKFGQYMRFWVGMTGNNRGRFNNIILRRSTTSPWDYDLDDLVVEYYTPSGWSQFPRDSVIDYFFPYRSGLSYIAWPSVKGDWIKSTLSNGMYGYFVRITGTGGTAASIRQYDEKVRTTQQPFIDISAPTSRGLPEKIRFSIYGLYPWESSVLQSETPDGNDNYDKSGQMSSLIIASVRSEGSGLLRPPAGGPEFYPFVQDNAGMGFYNLYTTNPMAQVRLWPDAHPTVGEAASLYSPDGTRIYIPQISQFNLTDGAGIASLTMPFKPGSYRIFTRYFVTEGAAGTMYVWANISQPNNDMIAPNTGISSSRYAINVSSTLGRERMCLADMGIITIHPGMSAYSKSSLPMTKIVLMGKSSSGSHGNVGFLDLILLPLNDSFMALENTRGPLARNGQRASYVQVALRTVNNDSRTRPSISEVAEEFICIDSLSPGGTTASLVRSQNLLSPSIYKEKYIVGRYNKMGGEDLLVEPGYSRRFWFLWYKRLRDGMIASDPYYNFGVVTHGANQLLTPQMGPGF